MKISRANLMIIFAVITLLTAEILNMRTLTTSEQIAHINNVMSVINPIVDFGVNFVLPIIFFGIVVLFIKQELVW